MPPRSPRQPGRVRLQRYLADAGVASRRKCESMIEDGLVRVNGATVTTLPCFVDPSQDKVTVGGRTLERPRKGTGGRTLCIMLNKPDHCLSTLDDTDEHQMGRRRTIADLVRHPSGARLFPVGRLDYHAVGLLLLTNDGDLSNRLTHARYGVARTYRVVTKGVPDERSIRTLARRVGAETVELDALSPGPPRKPARADRPGTPRTNPGDRPAVRVTKSSSQQTTIEVTIKESASKRIDELLPQAGILAKRIERVAIAGVRMRGVARGKWRELSPSELERLRQACGLDPRSAGKAGNPGKPRRRRPGDRPETSRRSGLRS